MVAKTKLHKRFTGGSYFAAPKTGIEFISSGCKLFDMALGGGWAENRIGNIVGDKSTGKTLLCIEAAANFALKYPRGSIRYRESEAAFDRSYAAALGMPIDRIDFGAQPLETVEDFFEDLDKYASHAKNPELYICDSLDALSDRAEMERDMDQGTYGAEKAKKMSQLFRRLTRQMAGHMTLLIVSQVRSTIGRQWGPTTARTGGRALDFYASQVVFLSQLGKVSRTINKIKRPTGVRVLAKVDKNKVSLPFREAEFQISFGYGIDDLAACLEWLKSCNFLGDVDLGPGDVTRFLSDLQKVDDKAFTTETKRIHAAVEKRWYEVETSFLPTRRKYGENK